MFHIIIKKHSIDFTQRFTHRDICGSDGINNNPIAVIKLYFSLALEAEFQLVFFLFFTFYSIVESSERQETWPEKGYGLPQRSAGIKLWTLQLWYTSWLLHHQVAPHYWSLMEVSAIPSFPIGVIIITSFWYVNSSNVNVQDVTVSVKLIFSVSESSDVSNIMSL